ncbi:MAG TPA: M56 family metallopeptidase, partial [Thermoguttaceae bacterium]|nr:M56 family metallopeptidase [Thermoguttaceae bacterium]
MNASSLWDAFRGIETRYSLELTQALVHSLWQGCAIAIAYAVLAHFLRQASANTRYVAGVTALLLMAASLPVTLLVLPSLPTAAVDTAAHPGVIATSGTTSAGAAETGVSPVGRAPVAHDLPAGAARPSGTARSPGVDSRGVSIRGLAARGVTTGLAWASPHVVYVYLGGVVLMLSRVAFGFWGGRRLRSACTAVTDGPLWKIVGDHARRLGIRLIPVVAYCRRVSVPVVVGVLRPTILVPASLASGLTPRQLEAVLVHELAHIRRFDPAVNVLQRLVEAMLFFHPAVWWVSRRITVERENACDDLVLRSDCPPTDYAEALVRIGELCSGAAGDRRPLAPAALAATGKNSSQFKRRVLRVLNHAETPAIRLTTTGVVISMLLILSVLLAPVAWRSAARAEQPPEAATVAADDDSPEGARLPQGSPPAKREALQPVSMSAEEFGQLPKADQRALLVRVFRRRLEHSEHLHYELEQVVRRYENRDGEPGKPLEDGTAGRWQYRHWRLGDSFRMDVNAYRNLTDADFASCISMGVNGEEGVGRNTTIRMDGSKPPSGQVRYPFHPSGGDRYLRWLDSPKDPELGQHFFPYLLNRKGEFDIEAPVAGDKVRLSVPWQPEWAAAPGGSRVYLLDPQKGFLPVRCDSRYDDPPTKPRPRWRVEKFVVEEARLVGDVWMPIKLTEQVAASTVPDMIAVYETTVSRIECGTVRPADVVVPFIEGMKVVDTIEGVTYVADAQGNPAGPVKAAPGWRHEPPEGRPERKPAAPSSVGPGTAVPPAKGSPIARRLSAGDREMLRMEEEKERDRRASIAAALKVVESKPPAAQEERVEAALRILRIYRISENEAAWASAIRALILIGKPAVPTLIDELDRTKREETLRALGFVLRGIGDPRAVPALIRAIPRTHQPSGSDFGLRIDDDRELLRFMQQHDSDQRDGWQRFTYGRPIREIMPALEKMTGEAHGWMELNFASLKGGEAQQRIQRTLFLELAERWADWWSENWPRYVEDEADAQLDRTKRSLDEYSISIAAAPDRAPRQEFPRGPNVAVGGNVVDIFIESFDESPSSGFLDLDTGRHPKPPDELVEKSAGHEPSKQLLAWAEREGVDLINVRITPPGSDETFYAFQPVGMTVWRVEN